MFNTAIADAKSVAANRLVASISVPNPVKLAAHSSAERWCWARRTYACGARIASRTTESSTQFDEAPIACYFPGVPGYFPTRKRARRSHALRWFSLSPTLLFHKLGTV
ncbi:unnamed protein product, partial [Mesorhabditis spiculigera]